MISHHDSELLESTVPWRRSRLRRAGFDARLAATLAVDRRYDVEDLVALTQRGCPPGLAARILVPLTTDNDRR
jgi:hypothetical protein